MRNILILSLALALAAVVLACGTSPSGGAGSPTEAYKTFYAAVKSKNTDAIKAEMSQKTRAFAEAAAQRQGITIEKMLENGLTGTTFAESLPEMRDERVSGDDGSVEVWNAKDKLWEDLPFVREASISFEASGDSKAIALEAIKDLQGLKVTGSNSVNVEGAIRLTEAENLRTKLAESGITVKVTALGWKFAMGELFTGSFKSPGKGRAMKEREAANAMSGNGRVVGVNTNSNGNGNANFVNVLKDKLTNAASDRGNVNK
ncbi:MAG: hypothetical protein WKF92_06630 [Pyrinomonadaceae bacterium]